jgi:hypothetical protein
MWATRGRSVDIDVTPFELLAHLANANVDASITILEAGGILEVAR